MEVLHFDQQVVDRYPNQMYAGNPILFPQVSFNHSGGREHHYEWKGQTFPMPQHGFARKSKWRVTKVNETALAMELVPNDETRKVYPFEFRHQIIYELIDSRLHLHQSIENHGTRVMPFSTGLHPYFKVPLLEGSKREDCEVELPDCRLITQHKDWQSWTAEPFAARRISVQDDVSGTMFLTDFANPEIAIIDPASNLKTVLHFDSARYPFLALWAKSTAEPYYCIEPWTALPNSFARKETELVLLDPGQTWTAGIWIDLLPAGSGSL